MEQRYIDTVLENILQLFKLSAFDEVSRPVECSSDRRGEPRVVDRNPKRLLDFLLVQLWDITLALPYLSWPQRSSYPSEHVWWWEGIGRLVRDIEPRTSTLCDEYSVTDVAGIL